MDTFLPPDYEVPANGGKYLKFQDGENRFRILDRPVIGWEYWTNETRPMRLKQKPEGTPANIQIKNGKPTAVKHFWAFPVWNYKTKQVELCEVTQVSIQKSIEALAKNAEWGSPLNYDITVVKSGEGLDTEYNVMPQPPKALTENVEEVWNNTKLNLELMFEGKDPFEV